MKFGTKEISELTNEELADADRQCKDAFAKREIASQHEKFNVDGTKKKMEFPPPNPAFIKLQTEIEDEIKKRNLDHW